MEVEIKSPAVVKRLLGIASVDSGSLMIVDPCYVAHPCEELGQTFDLDKINEVTLAGGGPIMGDLGVASGTAFGDGGYPVYSIHENNHFCGIYIGLASSELEATVMVTEAEPLPTEPCVQCGALIPVPDGAACKVGNCPTCNYNFPLGDCS